MGYQLGDAQQATGAVAFSDKAGNPAKVQDGSITWSSSDESVVAVTQNPDKPDEATIVAQGPLGTATISVNADADLGDGVVAVSGSVDVEVVAGEAVAAAINFGAASPKPEAVPEPAPEPAPEPPADGGGV